MKSLLTIPLILLTFCLVSQTVIIDENFDTYDAGSKLVQTINDQSVWDTWSSAPGGSEDAVISDSYSNSPANSLYLANNNDIVMLFNDLTEGRYKLNFQLLIESGKIGYFNMLHDFAGGDSEWAFQVYFNANGAGSVDAGKTGAATFTYEYDVWNEINVIVDLDDDFATFYLNGEETVSWKWSTGTSGGGTMVKLDAVNFYGNTNGGSSGMYVDNVIFSSVLLPDAPGNLTAVVENEADVILNWDAPVNTPDNYILSRNNSIIASGLTDTSFNESPYPGDNLYSVRAHTIGHGYSHSSNEALAFIPGGLDREIVLFEIGTGTGCVFCPGAAMGAVDMINNGDNVAIIKYHNFNDGDPFNNEFSAERAGNYYGITGYPTSFADGTLSLAGGNANSSLFTTYHQHYIARKEKKALYSLDLHVFHLSGNDYRAEVTIEQHSGFNSEQKTLHTALTESDIDFTWFNQSQVHFTCRGMYPDAFGTALDFNDENSHSMNFDFSLGDDYVKDNCEFVVFLQADPSKEVMVATKIDLADVVLNAKDLEKLGQFDIYPNPANDRIYFNRSLNEDYQIFDLTGKIVKEGFTERSIDLSGIEKGVYFLKSSSIDIQKFIVQ